jgi:hypothetical protein
MQLLEPWLPEAVPTACTVNRLCLLVTDPFSMPSPRCVIDEAQDKHASGRVTPEMPSDPGPCTGQWLRWSSEIQGACNSTIRRVA